MRLIVLILLTIASSSADAYVGPGLGLGVLGALFGGILAVFLAILGVFWYPIKRLLKKKKSPDPNEEEKAPNNPEDQRDNSVD
jgi:hypothetical protein